MSNKGVGGPRAVVVGGQKGGTAKSTITQNLAVALALDGARVHVIDADADQHSTYEWYSTRVEAGHEPSITCAIHTGPAVAKAIDDALAMYTHVLIDTGGQDSKELRRALTKADLLVTPFLPFQCDVKTAAKMADVYDQALDVNDKLRALVVLTKAPVNKRVPEPDLARQFFTETYPALAVSDAVLRYRMAYPRAYQDGLGLLELKPGAGDSSEAEAVEEIRTLYREIYQ